MRMQLAAKVTTRPQAVYSLTIYKKDTTEDEPSKVCCVFRFFDFDWICYLELRRYFLWPDFTRRVLSGELAPAPARNGPRSPPPPRGAADEV